MGALRAAGWGLLGLLALLLAWGFLVEPRLIDVEHQAGPVPGLPREWAGRSVAVIADLQVGMWGANTGTMRRIVQRLLDRRPAAVLIAGDLVYHAGADPEEEIRTAVGILAPLGAAGIPTFAVLGNHDYALDQKSGSKDQRQARRLEEALEAAGVRVLRNEAVRLELRGAAGAPAQPLYLVGIGSEWAGEAHPERALAPVPEGAPRIVFMHNPHTFSRIPAGAAPLAVAAHTHGGQIRIPGTPSWSWLDIVAEGEAHADGWITDAGFGRTGNRLYVNRGIGFSDLPVRIHCQPEITVFRLRSASARAPGPR